MSEKAKEAPEEGKKKKKGKLPMIIILAVLLGGGGFFGMKMKGGGKKVVPPIKLGAMVEIKDEFLTNMAERNSYVRTKISLQFKKDYKVEAVEHEMAAIQDIINMKLQSTSVRSVATLDGMRALKRQIAEEVNKLLEELEPKEEAPEVKAPAKGAKTPGKPGQEGQEVKGSKEGKDAAKPTIPEGWDSAKGPVLKILFVSWATQ